MSMQFGVNKTFLSLFGATMLKTQLDQISSFDGKDCFSLFCSVHDCRFVVED